MSRRGSISVCFLLFVFHMLTPLPISLSMSFVAPILSLTPTFTPRSLSQKLGAMIVTGMENGNPLKSVISQQLNLPLHYLTSTDGALYDSSGKKMHYKLDDEAEKMFNGYMEEACCTIFPQDQLGTLKADKVDGYTKRNFVHLEESCGEGVYVSLGAVMEGILQREMSIIEEQERSEALRNQNAGVKKHWRQSNHTSVDLVRAMNWHVANLEFANGAKLSDLSCVHW